MKNLSLFEECDSTTLEKFEIIFDRAKNETIALYNAADYYLMLTENGEDIDIDRILNAALDYGFDISIEQFEQKIKELA